MAACSGVRDLRQLASLIGVGHEPIDERQARLQDGEQFGRAFAQDVHAGGRAAVTRAPEYLRGSIAPESAHRIVAAEMQMRRALDQRPRHVVDRIDGVGSDRMKRGPVSVWSNRKNAGRGLDAGLANDVAGIDAESVQRADEHVAESIVADGADRRDRESQFREADRGARRGPGRREPNLVEQHAALSLGDVRDVAAEDVEDVRAERHHRGRSSVTRLRRASSLLARDARSSLRAISRSCRAITAA